MTDRLNEIKERLGKVGVTAWRRQNSNVYMSDYHRVCIGDVSIAQLITHCPSDIAWLIAELEKANDAATKAYEWFYGAGTTEQEQAMCDAFFKWKGGPYTGSATKQIETVTEFRCGTETVYTDGTKDFEPNE